MKELQNYVNESKKAQYSVAFLDCKDNENMPINVTISVDAEYSKIFDKFVEDKADSIFAHASGDTIDGY